MRSVNLSPTIESAGVGKYLSFALISIQRTSLNPVESATETLPIVVTGATAVHVKVSAVLETIGSVAVVAVPLRIVK